MGMIKLKDMLLEGRVEDARQYIANSIGTEMLSDGSEEILGYFIDGDPSGNHKYLMWMVKMHDIDSGFSPNMLIDLVQRFHNNLDKIHPALVTDMGFYSASKVATSPKNIDSYPDYRTLKRIVEAAEESVTRKQREKEAKTGVDKLYEDDRWLLVRPLTYEGSCYYGSSTKWCTASKDAPQHFKNYSKTGNLFYIIDKSKDVGDFFKIALHKKWDGQEEWYDRADDELTSQTREAIRSILPSKLTQMIDLEHSEIPTPPTEMFTTTEFREELIEFVRGLGKIIKLKTRSGVWDLHIVNGLFRWTGNDPRVEVIANLFPEAGVGMDLEIDLYDEGEGRGDDDILDLEIEYGVNELSTETLYPADYLQREPPEDYVYSSVERNLKLFIMNIYVPKVRLVLDSDEMVDFVGVDYKTWNAESYVSSFTFKYPPREGTMTQKFTDYLKENPRRTSNQFYEDVLGRSRPRAHNNMFFSSIKDSGIVKMERQGRQFVYSLGPNYSAWTKGKLLRTNKKYGQL
jgi:hypothetical protein